MTEGRRRRPCGRANTIFGKSSKRCRASSGRRIRTANLLRSTSGFWTTAACNLTISCTLVGRNSYIRTTFRKPQEPFFTRSRPERPFSQSIVCAAQTENTAGITRGLSLYAMNADGSSSGMVCPSILTKAKKPKSSFETANTNSVRSSKNGAKLSMVSRAGRRTDPCQPAHSGL
jgi:hypothetical protein